MQAAVLKQVDDKDWAVRRQLAATLGTLPDGVAAKYTTLAALLQQSGDDPMVVDAALTGLNGSEQQVLEKLFAAPAATPQSDRGDHRVDRDDRPGRAGRRGAGRLQVDGRHLAPEWQRAALLAGAEAALLGRPLGGGGRRGAVPALRPLLPEPGAGTGAGPGGAPPSRGRRRQGGGAGAGGRGRGNTAPGAVGQRAGGAKHWSRRAAKQANAPKTLLSTSDLAG